MPVEGAFRRIRPFRGDRTGILRTGRHTDRTDPPSSGADVRMRSETGRSVPWRNRPARLNLRDKPAVGPVVWRSPDVVLAPRPAAPAAGASPNGPVHLAALPGTARAPHRDRVGQRLAGAVERKPDPAGARCCGAGGGAAPQHRHPGRGERADRPHRGDSGLPQHHDVLGRGNLPLPAARGLGGRHDEARGRRPGDRRRYPRTGRCPAALRGGQGRRADRGADRAGAAQRLHQRGRQYRARRDRAGPDRLPAGGGHLRHDPVPAAAAGGGAPLQSGPVPRRSRRGVRGARLRSGAGSEPDHGARPRSFRSRAGQPRQRHGAAQGRLSRGRAAERDPSAAHRGKRAG